MTTTINADTTNGVKITSDTSGVMGLQTAGNTAITINASQNVGIGTTSPATKLNISSAGADVEVRASTTTSGNVRFGFDADGAYYNWIQANRSSGAIQFAISNSEVMQISAGGNLGLGVTPNVYQSGAKAFQNPAGALYTINNLQQRLSFNAYRASDGNDKYIATGFATEYRQGEGSGIHSWHIAASGTAGNAITFTQAMTLNASGNLLLGTTTNTYTGSTRKSFELNASNDVILAMKIADAQNFYIQSLTTATSFWSVANAPLIFGTNNTDRARITAGGDLDLYITAAKDGALRWTGGGGGAVQGFIYCNGNPEVIVQAGGSGGVKLTSGATSWVTASDTRFKDIIEPIVNAVDKVNTLSAVIYSFKDDETAERRVGLIAQELLAVLPEAVHVPKKEEEMMGVRYTETIPLLVAAIKEQSALITQLTARITALEGA
jgi:hypothetical protein